MCMFQRKEESKERRKRVSDLRREIFRFRFGVKEGGRVETKESSKV